MHILNSTSNARTLHELCSECCCKLLPNVTRENLYHLVGTVAAIYDEHCQHYKSEKNYH